MSTTTEFAYCIADALKVPRRAVGRFATPSLRGKVSVMAGLMVEESDKGGLRLRKYRPFSLGGRVTESDLGSEGTQPPEKAETPLSESPRDEKAA